MLAQMDSTNSGSSGFNPHVMNQLQDISQRGRRNHNGRGRGRQHPPRTQTVHPQQPPDWSTKTEDFPPLGSQPLTKPSRLGGPQGPSTGPHGPPAVPPIHFHPPPHNPLLNAHHDPAQSFRPAHTHSPREFQDRARGNFRGQHSHFSSHTHQPQSSTGFPLQQAPYGRPPHPGGQLFNPNPDMTYGPSQHAQRSRQMINKKQANYLQRVGQQAYETHSLRKDEVLKKEAFRQELETVAQGALAAVYPGLLVSKIKLKCFGSLSNGFGLADSDMDLLLSLPEYQQGESVQDSLALSQPSSDSDATADAEEHGFKVEARRVLEKAFLDCGFGARLLTNTRVPILRVCSEPGAELLDNLRENRAAWDRTSSDTATVTQDTPISTQREPSKPDNHDGSADIDLLHKNLTELNLTDAVQPAKTARNNTKLEFTGDIGIPCDINFSNFVAVHNSTLLRLYHDFDSRVADVGFFVKVWAKARDINTPYRGTLSSYGYILMVLHYLMNVARPPVIPNLQALAKIEDGWYPDRPIELFEGFDIRFLRDRKEIEEARAAMPKNVESTGQLLRGFFHYYSVREGFHWMHDVISIREKTGRVTKAQKGWTEAKWSQQSKNQVRLRYLLAIEDPFEIEHNIARTVGHTGVVAIRDEFRRANAILEKLGTDVDVPLEEFLEPIANRGDTLRKDQEFHRQKQLQLKEEFEAKEKGMMLKASDESPDVNVDGMSGISNWVQSQGSDSSAMSYRQRTGSKLTGKPSQGTEKKERPPWCHRTVQTESDSEDDDSKDSKTTPTEYSFPNSDTVLDESNSRCGVNFMPGEVYVVNGFDEAGNVIGWDMDTQDGRWLQWRDNRVRAGQILNFRNPALRELDEQCPFDPQRPFQKKLSYTERREREKSKRPPWPLQKSKPEEINSNASQTANVKPSQAQGGQAKAATRMTPKDEVPRQNKVIKPSPVPETSSQLTERQRDLVVLMKSKPESMLSQGSAFLASLEAEGRPVVPATLYPGVKREERPRDEDPNIMPIPEELGFEFDVRQLQDLDAIAHGGNGCARDGAGFSVEADYEWGGGGMMGYKDSGDTQELPKIDAGTGYECGKGDDQGLLNELPGTWE